MMAGANIMNIFQIRFVLIEFLIEIDTFSRFKKKKHPKMKKSGIFALSYIYFIMNTEILDVKRE
jgi:hypothetical protein